MKKFITFTLKAIDKIRIIIIFRMKFVAILGATVALTVSHLDHK